MGEWPTFPPPTPSTVPFHEEHAPVVYNPMMGTRRDLEVNQEDGAAATARHETWLQKRRGYLDSLIADAGTSDEARAIYERERQRLG